MAKMAKILGTTEDDLRKHDSRAPVDAIKQRSSSEPAFGFALRKLVDKQISPEDLLKFVEQQPDRPKKKQ